MTAGTSASPVAGSAGTAPAGPIRHIAWVVSTLMQVGGGERLIFEVREALERAGVKVTLITWYLDSVAFFEGKYGSHDMVVLGREDGTLVRAGLFRRAARRITTLLELRWRLRALDPDMVVCQSEYDVVMVFLATLFTRYRYAAKIFGQTFLNVHDVAKYTLVFRRHLREIRNSMPGYVATVPLRAPKVGVLNRLVAELISVLRYVAVRRARVRFVLAPQSQWEVRLMYGCDAIVLRSGFPKPWLTYTRTGVVAGKCGLTGRRIVFCFSRLLPKKRVDLVIRVFAALGDEQPEAHLLIGGTGPEGPGLEQLVRELDIADRVTFAGYVPEREVTDYFADCSVVINLDVAQFDIVGNEALGARKPIVCLVENEFDEVFRRAGYVYDAPAEPSALARALGRALDAPPIVVTPELARALEERTWDAYAEKMLRHLSAIT